jgi:hypothetical protein
MGAKIYPAQPHGWNAQHLLPALAFIVNKHSIRIHFFLLHYRSSGKCLATSPHCPLRHRRSRRRNRGWVDGRGDVSRQGTRHGAILAVLPEAMGVVLARAANSEFAVDIFGVWLGGCGRKYTALC